MHEGSTIAEALALAEREWGNAPPPEPAKIPAVDNRGWFVIASKHRAEEDAADALRELGCDVFLPMMQKDIIHRRSRKIITRSFILVTGYLFAELPIDQNAWRFVRELEPIESILGAGGATPVPAAEIARFRAAALNGDFDETIEARIRRGEMIDPANATAEILFPKGSRIRVTAGPFFGYYGLVKNAQGQFAVKAMVETLRRVIPVRFPIDMIELAPPVDEFAI